MSEILGQIPPRSSRSIKHNYVMALSLLPQAVICAVCCHACAVKSRGEELGSPATPPCVTATLAPRGRGSTVLSSFWLGQCRTPEAMV